MKDNNRRDVIEIDLLELLAAMRQNLAVIIFTCIAGGIAAALISIFLIAPIYTSKTKLLVLTKETTLASLADLQMGSQLTNDYQVLITSRPVLQDVIEELSLDVTYQELAKQITINNPNNTRILELQVQDTDAERAADTVNCLARTASNFIGDQMEVVPPKIVEEGIVPIKRTSPSHRNNILIGILIGFLISGGLISFNTIMDDSIKSEEDIKKYLELPMLARVPDRKDFINLSEGETGGNNVSAPGIIGKIEEKWKEQTGKTSKNKGTTTNDTQEKKETK